MTRPRPELSGALTRSHDATSVQTAAACRSLDFAKTVAPGPVISSREAREPLPTWDKPGREWGRLPRHNGLPCACGFCTYPRIDVSHSQWIWMFNSRLG